MKWLEDLKLWVFKNLPDKDGQERLWVYDYNQKKIRTYDSMTTEEIEANIKKVFKLTMKLNRRKN